VKPLVPVAPDHKRETFTVAAYPKIGDTNVYLDGT
jgi:hypothetical protein